MEPIRSDPKCKGEMELGRIYPQNAIHNRLQEGENDERRRRACN